MISWRRNWSISWDLHSRNDKIAHIIEQPNTKNLLSFSRDITKAQSTLIRFQTKRSCLAPDTAIVHTTTPKTITENGVIQKRSPEWSDLKTRLLKTLFTSVDGENDAIWKRRHHQNRHDRAPVDSTVSIQNGGRTLPCGFNFTPISRADILTCACVEFIWACTLRV